MEQELLTQAQPPIGPAEAAEAERILHRYKAGKAALDRRLIDNELWFRMAHWKQYKNRMMEGKPQPSSGWLFNSIASKQTDRYLSMLDSYLSFKEEFPESTHIRRLDRLAEEGMRFENFFCVSPVCSPARASIFTGNIPSAV